MTAMNLQFNAQQIAPQWGGGGSLPVGKYPVKIVGSEVKPSNNDPQSGYIEFKLLILDGPHKGGSGPTRLNVYHKNPQTVEIAMKQLSAICHVVGVPSLNNDDSPLWDKPFVVEVQPQTDPKYTQVTGVWDINGREPAQCHFGQQQQAPQGFQQPQQQPQQNGFQQGGAQQPNGGNGGFQPGAQGQPGTMQGNANGAPNGWPMQTGAPQQPQQQPQPNGFQPQGQQQPQAGGFQQPNPGGFQQPQQNGNAAGGGQRPW